MNPESQPFADGELNPTPSNQYAELATSAAEIRYVSPADQDPAELPQHKFELVVGGKVIAGAEIDYLSKPLPLYQVTDIWSDQPGQGNASKIMTTVESFLRERRKPGVLVEAIMDDNPAVGMYAKRGWVSVPDSGGLHVYNWPSDVSLDVLQGYGARSLPLSDRASYDPDKN